MPEDTSNFSTESSWKITITNYKGVPYTIDSDNNSAIAGFTINESLFESNVITGDVKIFDVAGLDERIPLIGQERIRIVLKNKLLGGSDWDAEYTIVKRSATMEEGPTRFYVLDFCSDEFIANLRNRVSKSYKSKLASSIVEDIYDNYIRSDSFVKTYKSLHFDRKGDSDGTFYGMHFVFPTVRPFQAINMVVKRSVASNVEMSQNKKSANFGKFVFYENKFGFYFKALSDLLHPLVTQTEASFESPAEAKTGSDYDPQTNLIRNEGENASYVSKAPMATSAEIPMVSYVIRPSDIIQASPLQKEFTVVRYKLQSTFNILNNLIEGMYSGRLLTYDPTVQRIGTIHQSPSTPYIPTTAGYKDKRFTNRLYKANHKVTYYEYDYWKNFKDFRHVGGKNLSHTYPLTNDDHYGSGTSEAFYKYASTNFQHNEKMITKLLQNVMTDNDKGAISVDKQVERWLIQSYSQSRQMKNIITQITVPGDHNRVVGEIIVLKYPSNYYPDEEHSFYTGHYLITKVQHAVVHGNSYLTTMELAKDALFSRLVKKEEITGVGGDDEDTDLYDSNTDTSYGDETGVS
jgi:hypothetical protein